MLAQEEQQVVIDRLKEAEAEREQAMKALEAAKRVAEPSPETDRIVKLAADGRLLRHCVRGVQFFADP